MKLKITKVKEKFLNIFILIFFLIIILLFTPFLIIIPSDNEKENISKMSIKEFLKKEEKTGINLI